MYKSGLLSKISAMVATVVVMTGIVLVFFRDAALYASFVLVAIAFVALGIYLMIGYSNGPRTQSESVLRVNRVLADPWEKEQAPRKSRIVPIEPADTEILEISEQGAKLEAWISPRPPGSSDRPILLENPPPPEGS